MQKGRAIALLVCLVLLLAALPTALADAQMRDLSSQEFVRQMGLGWNLGNTLEATGGRLDSISAYETSWGNPLTTKEMLAKIAGLGVRSLRLPVAWSNLMAEDFTIHPDLMNRVEEITQMALELEMTVVINIHWDGGWFTRFHDDFGWAMAKYEAIWNQVSERFRDYPDKVVFESFNEVAWPKIFNHYGGPSAVTESAKPAFDLLNLINQRFVDLVLASGGNNLKRYLLIAGYNTDIELTNHSYFQMPKDAENRLMISVHYYHPWDFVGLKEDASYAKMRTTWGTPADMKDLQRFLRMMKPFTDRGIGVVLGEYSVCDGLEFKEPFSIRLWDTSVTRTALQLGYCPMLWDNGHILLNRNTLEFYDEELASQLSALAPALP